MTKVRVVQQERLHITKCRRCAADIDQDVVHGAVGTAYEFGLTPARASVHSANHTPDGAGLGVLDERRRQAGLPEMVVEGIRVESPGEQATIVTERLRHEHEDVCKAARLNSHEEMVP